MNPFLNLIELSQKECASPIQAHLVYATRENFLGRIVSGYHPNALSLSWMTESAALALCKVQNELNQQDKGLFIFDSYRPLRAVQDFHAWMQAPVTDEYELVRKAIHYPHLEKNQLSDLGYLAADVSNHCFGDTVDLSIIDLKTNCLVDMGAVFDFFDDISHTTATAEQIGQIAFDNRCLLSHIMQKHSFIPYEKEFWHYTFHYREINLPQDFEITSTI